MTFGPPNRITLYDPLTGLAYPRAASYHSESEPDPYLQSRVSGLTSRLRDPQHKCDRNLGLSIDWAVAYIIDHIAEKTDAAETFRNVRIKAAALEREGLTEAIPYRIFNKLDETLFAGHLKNAVFLETKSLDSDVSGATYNPNWGPIPGVQRISIILNADVLDASARDIVAILIHHMIHAFFLVACGPQKEDEVEYGRLGHGYHFSKIMATIKKLSAAHGKELTPLGVGHNLNDVQAYGETWYMPRRRPSAGERESKDKWYCSHCYSSVDEIPDSDIEKWYDKTCKPMGEISCKAIRSATVHIYNERRYELETKPRGRLPSSSKTVEFMYKDKTVLVEKKRLERLISVLLAFEKSKSRFFKIEHKEVSEATFLRFLEFAHTATYRPDPSTFNPYARKGAPIFKPSSAARTDTPILNDILFAQFGTLHGIPECQSIALKRLDAYGSMHEDPIAILSAIFSGGEPTPKLKDWARTFLLARDEHGTPNLARLQSDNGVWKARLRDAMDESGALENCVRRACEEGGCKGLGGGASNLLLSMGGAAQSPFHHLHQQQQQLLLSAAGIPASHALSLAATHANPLMTTLPQLWGSQFAFGNQNQNLIADSAYDLERQKRQLERERRQVERERDRLKETAAQVQAAAVLESMMGRGMEGWVEEEDFF